MAMITARCWRDAQYREEFVQDPKRVLREEGLDVPDDLNLHVVMDSPTDRYLVLPPAPDEMTLLTASDADLMRLASAPQFTWATVTVWLYAASVAIAAAGAVATLIIVVT